MRRKPRTATDYFPYAQMAVFGTLYACLSLLRHWHFGSSGYDLGIFDQAIWHYSRFSTPASTIRGVANVLGDHFSPILVILSPLDWVFRGPEGILLAQAALIALSVLPVYWFIKKRLGFVGAALISIGYVLFWGIQNAVAFDFHEIAFAVPLIAFSIYFIDKKNWQGYWICASLLLLTKEDLAVLVIFFGVYLCLKKEWKAGIISGAIGVIWFFAVTKIFIPFFAGAGAGYAYWTYTDIGSSPMSALKKMIFHPLFIKKTLTNSALKLKTARYMFNPFLRLPFVSLLLVLAVPLIAERFLSTNIIYWVTDFHYTATISPILAMAAADGLRNITQLIALVKVRKTPLKKFNGAIIIATSALILLNVLRLVPDFPLWNLTKPGYWQLSTVDRAGYEALQLIPANASVAALDGITPHLTHRQKIYSIKGDEPNTDYVVVCSCAASWPLASQSEVKQVVDKKLSQKFTKIYDKLGWVVLKHE